MWTGHLKENAKLTVCLGKSVSVHSIIFYNYPCSSDEQMIGVKAVSIKVKNEETLSKPSVMIARQLFPSPSEFGNDIKQEFLLKSPVNNKRIKADSLWQSKHPVRVEELSQTNMPPIRVFGQFVRIRLLENYGDHNYIGLNGLEVYDSSLSPLLESGRVKFQLCADPVMASMRQTEGDLRVPKNLYNGKHESSSKSQVWMAPFINRWKLSDKMNLNRLHNQIGIFFERPVDIAAVSFWNYSIDARRGVRQAEVFVDEQLVSSVGSGDPGLHLAIGRGDGEDGRLRGAAGRAARCRAGGRAAGAPGRPQRALGVQSRGRPGSDGLHRLRHVGLGRPGSPRAAEPPQQPGGVLLAGHAGPELEESRVLFRLGLRVFRSTRREREHKYYTNINY